MGGTRARALLVIGALVIGAVASALPAAAAPSTAADAPIGSLSAAADSTTLLVGVRAGVSSRERQSIEHAAGTPTVRALGSHLLQIQVPPGQLRAKAQELARQPNVRYVEPSYKVHATVTPNDPYFGAYQWDLQNGAPGVDAPTAWSTTTGSNGIVVGVLDTGIAYTHPDLAANVWSNPGGVGGCAAGTHGVNEIAATCDPADDDGHGTHVSGTIGAVGNNGVGVTGENWTTSLMGLKMLDSTGNGDTGGAIAAIEFAVQAKQSGVNVRVLSASWAGNPNDPPSQGLHDAIVDAGNAGILFVTAAGNAAPGGSPVNVDTSPVYPCSYHLANEICVAATTNSPPDTLADFSNYGASTVDLAAPGVNILSTWPSGNPPYAFADGTSMATPHVSGAAALVLSAKNISLSTLKSILLSNVTPIAGLAGKVTTGGRLDLANAVAAASALPPAWSAWESPQPIGGGLGSGPAAASWAPNRLDVFARGSDGRVKHLWGAQAWSGWEDLGGGTPSEPGAVSWGPNRIDLFVRGGDNQLWHEDWNGSAWSGWEPLGGQITSGPAVASWASGRLDIFARGTDGIVWQKSWTGAWSGWTSVGGLLTGNPAAVSQSANSIDVVVRGVDDHVWHNSWTGSAWAGWQPLGGTTNAGPAISSGTASHLDLFVRGTDGQLWHQWWRGSAWSGWEPLAGSLSSGPAAVSWGPNRIDVFGRGATNQVAHLAWM